MQTKQAKIIIDVIMSILLLLLMSYQVTGDFWHEWIGTGMLVLFLIHNILNYRWYGNLLRGKYNAVRSLMTVVNVLCLISMLCLMVSGIMMSRHVFAWLPIESSMSFARMLHMAASYQGFLYMSLHIGLHWRMAVVKADPVFAKYKISLIFSRVILAGMAIYGLVYFAQAKLWRYMFAQDMFVFLDYERAAVLVLFDHLCVMVFWAAVAYYLLRLLGMLRKKKK